MANGTKPIKTTDNIELTDDNWSLDDWLDGTEYAEVLIEVFNKGDLLSDLDELLKFIQSEEQEAEARRANAKLIGGSITDEQTTAGNEEVATEAKEQVDKIIAELKGTGVIYHLRGISPGERKAIEEKITRAMKPRPAQFEDIEGERMEVRAAEAGGRQHPRWFVEVGYELAAKSIIGVTPPASAKDGERPAERAISLSVEDIKDKLEAKLGGSEWARLIGGVYDVNYYSYDIDAKVTVDFS